MCPNILKYIDNNKQTGGLKNQEKSMDNGLRRHQNYIFEEENDIILNGSINGYNYDTALSNNY